MKNPLFLFLSFIAGAFLAAVVFGSLAGNSKSEDASVIASLQAKLTVENEQVRLAENQILEAHRLLSEYGASVKAAQNTATAYQEQVSSIQKSLIDFESVDTVIYQTVSSPNELQGIGKMLTLLSINPALKGFGTLLASSQSNQETAPMWVLPGKLRPLFLGGNIQGMQYKWIDAKTGADESGMLSPVVPNQ